MDSSGVECSAVSAVPLPLRRRRCGPCSGRVLGALPDLPRVGQLLVVGHAAQEVLEEKGGEKSEWSQEGKNLTQN